MSQPTPALPLHRYRLRPDCTVRMNLPDDLTRGEAKRLAMFLSSLVRSDEWPYPVSGDHLEDDDFPDDEDDVLDEKQIQAFLDGVDMADELTDPDDKPVPAPKPPQPDM